MTIADAFPAVADTSMGSPGTVAGVTAKEGAEDGESPRLFRATTLKLIGVPFSKPVKVTLRTFPTVIASPTEGVIM